MVYAAYPWIEVAVPGNLVLLSAKLRAWFPQTEKNNAIFSLSRFDHDFPNICTDKVRFRYMLLLNTRTVRYLNVLVW